MKPVKSVTGKIKIRKGDKVKVIAGRDVDKEGTVGKVIPRENRVVVSEVNLLKKFVKKGKEGEPSGIITVAGPIDISSIMLVCPKCGKPTRVGLKLKPGGKKIRVCRRCREEID
jgi:large subunit ribosomal protein L24